MHIGQGIDCHAFSDDHSRPLIIAGVTIPGARGLDGHSDADVATHALMDALLGAACLGDLGRHFPATHEFNGARSLELLDIVMERVAGAGWRPISADVTVIAQVPRLADHLEQMATVLSGHLGHEVSVKATTTDHLGAIGRGEGITAMAIALLEAL